ncbi:hypothetical protein [Micromonospora sp. NBC_01813]|uniref:hypothetical protein n=1 Tax=Micromonospora sp. NBC_01813 TaxID=2975988 RepID=UPI002DD86DA3|nr:hypothetical protein [Micromonospora sp. NBC_01813]WSA06174.1 hypothetical protein OG958_17730 [Micromonospora sp. NBC_01813]
MTITPFTGACNGALEETLDVLSSQEAMRQLADSQAAIAAGDVLDSGQLAALLRPCEGTWPADAVPNG